MATHANGKQSATGEQTNKMTERQRQPEWGDSQRVRQSESQTIRVSDSTEQTAGQTRAMDKSTISAFAWGQDIAPHATFGRSPSDPLAAPAQLKCCKTPKGQICRAC